MSSDPSRSGPGLSPARSPGSFGRDRRILRRSEFLKTYATGKRYAGRWLVLFVRTGPSETTRLGVTITRKTGSAVVRNRLRRRIRELFRRSPLFPEPMDVVVNVRPGAESAPYEALAADYDRLSRRAAGGGAA